jgi:membrane protein
MNVRLFFTLLWEAASEWQQDRAPRLGAALAFYMTFALTPLLFVSIAVASMIFGEQAARGQILHQVSDLIGEQPGKLLQSMLANANQTGATLLVKSLGIGMVLIGAIGLFAELQDALNTIWKVPPRTRSGVYHFFRDRLLAFCMVLICAFLLLSIMLFGAFLTAVKDYMGPAQAFNQVIVSLATFGMITVLFAMIYRFLPDVKIAWKYVWLGAFVTAVLFSAGKVLIGFYLGQRAVASAYEAAGTLAVLLMWLYYAAQIFLFGAELTKVYANHFGGGHLAEDEQDEAPSQEPPAKPTGEVRAD